jgi:hypothetical protein
VIVQLFSPWLRLPRQKRNFRSPGVKNGLGISFETGSRLWPPSRVQLSYCEFRK